MTQSSQSRGGIRIKSYHSPFLYILITLILLTILCFTILSIRLSLTNAVEEDTGKATLTNVAITQAGTGQSVTIDGITMDETTYGSNTTRRTILNNNVVRYSANYQVAAPGTITLSITLPANNTIDEATIGTAQGCLAGSKLEQVATNGKKSYTNNKATCVMNATSIGQVSWGITAYLWGGNNTKIQPTISLSGQEQSQKPDPITVVGKGNYGVKITNATYNSGFTLGYNMATSPDIGLYIPKSDTNILGVEPVDSYTVKLDTTQVPDGWIPKECGMNQSNGLGVNVSKGIISSNKSGASSQCEKSADGNSLTITISNLVTATANYSLSTSSDGYFYSANGLSLAVPISSIPSDGASFTLKVLQTSAVGINSGQFETAYVAPTLSFWITGKASGMVRIFPQYMMAWSQNFSQTGPVYSGQTIFGSITVTTKVLDSYNANNLDVCVVWDADELDLQSVSPKTHVVSGGGTYDFGVVAEGTISSLSACGKVGDGANGFYDSLDDARQYAESVGSRINVIRMHLPKLANTTDDPGFLQMFWTVASDSNIDSLKLMSTRLYAKTDEWNNSGVSSDYYRPRLTPGLLSHTITAVPSSNAPNTTEHITITPKTYNKDTNAQITTTLPKGLTYQANSFKVANHQLTQGLDYTITKDSSNGSTKITFNLDQIATIPGLENITGESPVMPGEPGNTTDLPIAKDNNGNGITRDSIEFDVLIDRDVPTPSTLTITSQTSGTGTNYASSSFRSASTNITISQARIFGYNLTSSASSLNVNEDLTYTYSNYNLTDNDITNLDTISVLPYNNDAKGETSSHGLTSYNIANLAISANNSNLPLPTLYYTTSPLVRELEQTNPTELATNSSITWTKCTLDSQGKCTNLPNTPTSAEGSGSEASNGGVTAIRWQLPNFAQAAQYYVSLTINNLDAEPQANLVNDITYVAADGITPATHQLPTTTSYIGESLELRLDTTNLTTTIEPNSATSMTNQLTILANTRHGYNLTIQMVGDSNSLIGKSTNQAIPAINTQPTKGTLGWSISTNNTTWQAVPPATSLPLLLQANDQGGQITTTLPITYSFSTTKSTLADTYQGQIVYTLVGEWRRTNADILTTVGEKCIIVDK